MRRTSGSLALAALVGACALGCSQQKQADARPQAAAANAQAAAINSYCPLGKEPVVAEVGTVSYKGHAIGFCCPGCMEMWESVPEADRDAFIAAALEGTEDRVGG